MNTRLGIAYHGFHRAGGGVVAVETTAGAPLGMLGHRVRHSPTGFGWGYAGSGPADLARSLLLAAVGDLVRCPTCTGAAHVEIDDNGVERPATAASAPEAILPCNDCDEGSLITPAIYQRFKFDVIAALGSEWRMTRDEVREWWRTHVDAPGSLTRPTTARLDRA